MLCVIGVVYLSEHLLQIYKFLNSVFIEWNLCKNRFLLNYYAIWNAVYYIMLTRYKYCNNGLILWIHFTWYNAKSNKKSFAKRINEIWSVKINANKNNNANTIFFCNLIYFMPKAYYYSTSLILIFFFCVITCLSKVAILNTGLCLMYVLMIMKRNV